MCAFTDTWNIHRWLKIYHCSDFLNNKTGIDLWDKLHSVNFASCLTPKQGTLSEYPPQLQTHRSADTCQQNLQKQDLFVQMFMENKSKLFPLELKKKFIYI